ncbi:MAG: hypothetical protein L0Y71_22470 [Gemmataceae bacterium]|nr:hypothetical protein [Gemmataceae bacterium]
MLELWNLLSVGLFDALLGWLLVFPRWIALVVVGLATAALLTLARKWTTNQDRLARAAADLRRLKALGRAAKDAHDADAVQRCNLTKGQVRWITLRAEGRPLLAVLLPVALLATWAFERLAYYPPAAGETITVVAYVVAGDNNEPARSAENDLMHLVGKPGLRARNGWVQLVQTRTSEPSIWQRLVAFVTFREAPRPDPNVSAVWQLQADANAQPYPLVFRWNEHTFQRELLIGQRIYSPVTAASPIEPPVQVVTNVGLRDVRLLGIPGLGAWLPAWLVGYLLVTIPFVFVLKRVLGVY